MTVAKTLRKIETNLHFSVSCAIDSEIWLSDPTLFGLF